MKRIDVANGDADGLCALHQLRLAGEGGETLVTGVKRDIGLLARVEATDGDLVTVCDVSLGANRPALVRLLGRGVRVRYFDHHASGPIPHHRRLKAHIDTQPGSCTSLIVDRYLRGRYRAWAVAAAFGDNLPETAERLARDLGLGETALVALREMGESMNYNAYGESIEDLISPPQALYRLIGPYADPLRCFAVEPVFEELRHARSDDLERASHVRPVLETADCAVHVLPHTAWARRVSGLLSNRLAIAEPGRAHAVLVPSARGGFIVSVRAPKGRPKDAAALCRQFPGGGGRSEAAGINSLPEEAVGDFVRRFEAYFG